MAQTQLLRAPHGCGGEFFVDAGLEHHVLGFEVRLRFLQQLVVRAQRRAAVTADETRGVVTGQRIALVLQHGQLDQGLHAAHEGVAVVLGVFVVE